MKTDLLRSILRSMSWHVFSDYVFDLFSLSDSAPSAQQDDGSPATLREWRVTEDLSHTIAEGTLEQHYQRGLDLGSYTVFFVQPLLIDLFGFPQRGNLSDPGFLKKLRKYKKYSDRRLADWQFWTDGDHCMERVAIVSNISGFPEEHYQKVLLPELQSVLDGMKFNAQAVMGSIDTFIDTAPDDAAEALCKFFTKRHGCLTITCEDDGFRVREAIPGNYIASGVLRGNQTPCEPIMVRPLQTHVEVISAFEDLLNQNASEHALERFLVEHYREIFGYQYNRVEAQVWLRFPELDVAGKSRRLDIFLRNSVENDWELFELKKCTKLTSTYRDAPVLTAEICSATQQLKSYGAILSQDRVRRWFVSQGIEYYQPSLHLVVGRSPEVSAAQWRWLKATHGKDVRLITYDELIREMATRLDIFKIAEPMGSFEPLHTSPSNKRNKRGQTL